MKHALVLLVMTGFAAATWSCAPEMDPDDVAQGLLAGELAGSGHPSTLCRG